MILINSTAKLFLITAFTIVVVSCNGQNYIELQSSFQKYLDNKHILATADDLRFSEKYFESKEILNEYAYSKNCDFLNLQFYISCLSTAEMLRDSAMIASHLRKAILAGYHSKYFKLEKWKKYLIDSEFDSLHLVYINSLNLKYAVELSKMFDNDQGYRNSIKVKDSVKYIDSINILIFDNLVKDYGYPSLNKYGNDFNYDNESINCSPYILITHFGEQHWHRYLDTMILSAFHETDSWYDVEFIMKTIIMRKSNLVNFIPLRFVGSDSFKEFLLLKNLKDIFHQYPTLKWEVQIADNLSAAKTIEIKNLLLNCTQNNDQINFDSVRFKNDADEFGKFCVKFKRLTGIN